MSNFMSGFLLGGGNVFGNPPAAGGDGGAGSRARLESMDLQEQMKGLQAEIVAVEAVRDALKLALAEVAPNHPLIDVDKRNEIFDRAYNDAMSNP